VGGNEDMLCWILYILQGTFGTRINLPGMYDNAVIGYK